MQRTGRDRARGGVGPAAGPGGAGGSRGTGRALRVPSAAERSGRSGRHRIPDAGMAAAQLLLAKISHDRGFLPLLCPRAGGARQPTLPGPCGRCPVLPPAAEGHGDAHPWGESREPGMQSHTCKWRREKKERLQEDTVAISMGSRVGAIRMGAGWAILQLIYTL